MDDLTRLPATDPTDLFRLRDGLYGPEMLGAAVVGLDFFTRIAKTPADAAAICASFGLAERPTDVMLTLFCALGLLENRAGVFHATQKARDFFVSDSPWFIGHYYTSFAERPVVRNLLEVLHSGRPAAWSGKREGKPWAEAMEDDAFAREFTDTMDARGVYLGPVLARAVDLRAHRKLLDVGGGSGIYACCLAAANPQLRAAVFEKPPVDRATRKCIERRGYAERVDVVRGDMFEEDLPGGYDVHLWSNALHDWEPDTVRKLMEKSFAALPEGGLMMVHDTHINREKNGPLPVAAHSVFLMAVTEGKCYSIGEMEETLGKAGFRDFQFRETALDRSVITARKP